MPSQPRLGTFFVQSIDKNAKVWYTVAMTNEKEFEIRHYMNEPEMYRRVMSANLSESFESLMARMESREELAAEADSELHIVTSGMVE